MSEGIILLDGLDIRSIEDLITVLQAYKDKDINRDEMMILMDHLKQGMMFWGIDFPHIVISPSCFGMTLEETREATLIATTKIKELKGENKNEHN